MANYEIDVSMHFDTSLPEPFRLLVEIRLQSVSASPPEKDSVPVPVLLFAKLLVHFLEGRQQAISDQGSP